MSETVSPKLVVIGLGLIGGSLAAALKVRNAGYEVIGLARKPETAEYALAHNVIDRAISSIDEVADELTAGDIVFVAVPTLSAPAVLGSLAQKISDEVTITDGISVKGSVVDAAIAAYGKVPPQFVPGHPIAGSEKSGVTAALPDLYVNHRIILTPLPETDEQHLQRVNNLWQSVGAEVLHMPYKEHDAILGATSHLPHAIAYSLVDTLANDAENENIFRYAAGGFRDFTRIASSDPRMWHDIMCANQQDVLKAIDLFQNNLANLRQAIANKDSDTLLKIFNRAKTARDEFSELIDKQKSD